MRTNRSTSNIVRHDFSCQVYVQRGSQLVSKLARWNSLGLRLELGWVLVLGLGQVLVSAPKISLYISVTVRFGVKFGVRAKDRVKFASGPSRLQTHVNGVCYILHVNRTTNFDRSWLMQSKTTSIKPLLKIASNGDTKMQENEIVRRHRRPK